jgi:hypothetical protein
MFSLILSQGRGDNTKVLSLRKFVAKSDGERTGLNSNSRPSEHKRISWRFLNCHFVVWDIQVLKDGLMQLQNYAYGSETRRLISCR